MSLKVTPVILFDIYSRLHHELSHNSRTKWLSFFNYSDLLFVLPLRSLFAPPVYFKHESLRGIYGTDKWVTVKKPLLLFLPWGICDVCVIWYHLCHLKKHTNNTSPWVFCALLKLYKWYQIMQSISIYQFWKSWRLEDKSRRQFQRYPGSLRRRPYKNNVGECTLVFLSKTFRYFSAFLISLLQWNIILKIFNQLDQVVSLQ